MPKTHLPSLSKSVCIALACIVCICNYGFNVFDPGEQELLSWSNKCLTQSFAVLPSDKLKKWELVLTPDAFIRLKKTYVNGKQEFFSFHLQRFNDMDYLGTAQCGVLKLRTDDADIIVQTHHDRKGNIDTMASELTINVKNMEPERLDSLRSALLFFKKKTL
ncbi:hypothetical protein DJ568_12925 [Mucilaginibacter hurinus]|uniref:Uncharacterized protein n=1 Tax=Mucilaginibacter hurinus TaxID=2201324 RepID=A0A367GLJ7_9SPHI|nr:hypothetical protein [Mucilaginibacter hurinus]RCH54200.1 hypothetical protein DJ568_12925 [Mucilaginibacter hurinus]